MQSEPRRERTERVSLHHLSPVVQLFPTQRQRAPHRLRGVGLQDHDPSCILLRFGVNSAPAVVRTAPVMSGAQELKMLFQSPVSGAAQVMTGRAIMMAMRQALG